MYITYIIIGFILTILGLTSAAYFLNYFVSKKFSQTTIDSFLDAFITIVLGICYLYCAYLLSENESDVETTLNFNNISENVGDTAIMLEESADSVYDSTEMNFETVPTVSTVFPTNQTSNDEFLANYQKFFEDIIKQKQQNASWHNKTIYFNNKQYKDLNPRRKRATPADFAGNFEEYVKNKCFTKTFVENAVMLYSFLHCLLSLVNKTILCKNCDKKEEKNETNNKTAVESFSDESSSNSWLEEPIVEMFKAKSAVKQAKIDENTNETRKTLLLPILSVFFTILLPIVTVLVFYGIMQVRERPENVASLPEFDFNSTKIDSDVLKLLQSPQNATQDLKQQKEIKNVVDNVYNIVNKARQTVRTQLDAPIMYDIVYYLNKRDKSDLVGDCSHFEVAAKFYFFVVHVLVYFVAVLYAKSVQIRVRMEEHPRARDLNVSIMSMAILWLPNALETYYRMNLQQAKTNLMTDVCLAMGNANRVVTLIRNYLEAKRSVKSPNFVQPTV